MTKQKSVPPAAPHPATEVVLRAAAKVYLGVVASLGETTPDGKMSYFEASPTKNPEAYNRWLALNEAGKVLKAAIEASGAAPQTPAEPVAWVFQSTLDGSYRLDNAAVVGYAMFDKMLAKLQDDPWVKGGRARIVPLYASPHSAGPAPDSVAPTLSGSGESSSPSVGSSVADRKDAARYRWLRDESSNDFGPAVREELKDGDPTVWHLKYGRLDAAIDAAMGPATEPRPLGAKETISHDTGGTKDSVVVEADSNAVPSTLSVPRSSPK